MSPDQKAVIEFLRDAKGYVPEKQLAIKIGPRKLYLRDRFWIRPLLRRMEMEGLIESNSVCEYRLPPQEHDTNFWRAMEGPDDSLGETTIIRLEDVK